MLRSWDAHIQGGRTIRLRSAEDRETKDGHDDSLMMHCSTEGE